MFKKISEVSAKSHNGKAVVKIQTKDVQETFILTTCLIKGIAKGMGVTAEEVLNMIKLSMEFCTDDGKVLLHKQENE